jgi:hypothetical protein
MTPDQQRTVDQVTTLFPVLDISERMEWIKRLESWFPSRMECMATLTRQIATNRRSPLGENPAVEPVVKRPGHK